MTSSSDFNRGLADQDSSSPLSSPSGVLASAPLDSASSATEESHWPPAPKISKLKQTKQIMGSPFEAITAYREEFGDIFRLETFALGRMIFLCNADLLDQVYRMPEEDVVAGEIRLEQVGYLVGEQASINLDGEPYRRRRQTLAPMLTPRAVAPHTETVRGLAEEAAASWPVGEVVSLESDLYRISLDAIARLLFGPLEEGRNRLLRDLSEKYLEAFRSPFVQMRFLHLDLGRWTPWGRFLKIRRALEENIDAEIRDRLRRGLPDEPVDMMSGLLAAADGDSEEDLRIVRHECVGMIVGGGETTSRSLIWNLILLLQHPEVLERVHEELDEVLGDRPITAADFCRLPYLDAVINEGMRYQPAGAIAGPRLVKRPIHLAGYTIPPGAVLLQCLREVGRSDRFPNPHHFDPDNFFGRKVKLQDWLPFGGGARACTGQALARLELAVIMATWLQRIDFELVPGSLEPVRAGFLFEPKGGLKVRVLGTRR